MSEQVYPTVDPAELEPEYSEHLRAIGAEHDAFDGQEVGSSELYAMTRFAAIQLALRDREIARLVGEDSGGRCEACGHYEADLKRAREFAHCPSCNTGTRGGNLWLRVAPGDAAAIQSLAAERDAALARVKELEAMRAAFLESAVEERVAARVAELESHRLTDDGGAGA